MKKLGLVIILISIVLLVSACKTKTDTQAGIAPVDEVKDDNIIVDENKDSIAVVSKRAVSKGHILIIPKRVVGDVKDLPASVFGMAKKIAKKMVSKLNCKSTEIQSENVFGETVVNIIPVYDRPVGVGSERSEVSDEGMNEIWKLLRVVKKPKVIRIKKKADKQEKVLRLRRRIA